MQYALRTVRRHRLVEAGDRVLVAVSGGPDSTALLGVLNELAAYWKIDIAAGHVNHRLRPVDAERDAEVAAETARRLGVPFQVYDLGETLTGEANLEERARTLRYRALHSLAQASGCNLVATGHTADDQAETVLMRLLRGVGVDGLRGILPRRGDGVIRPLLECRREDVFDFLRAHDLPYRLDRTNLDRRRLRNSVRWDVLPSLQKVQPEVVRILGRTAEVTAEQAEVLRAVVEDAYRGARDGGGLRVALLRLLAAPLRREVLRRWLKDVRGSGRGLGRAHVLAVESLILRGGGTRTAVLPGGQTVSCVYDRLTVGEIEAGAAFDAFSLLPPAEARLPGWRIVASPLRRRSPDEPLPSDLWHAVCDGRLISLGVTVRPARQGERVRPLGLGGRRRLSDVFVDRRVPRHERGRYPVVEAGGEVVWVPGVVRTEFGRLDESTKDVFVLQAFRTDRTAWAVAGGEPAC